MSLGRMHAIDEGRTIVHDNDRAGDYYSTWCVCGQKLTSAVPNWRKDTPGGGSSVEDALERHRKLAAVREMEPRNLRIGEG